LIILQKTGKRLTDSLLFLYVICKYQTCIIFLDIPQVVYLAYSTRQYIWNDIENVL